MEEKNYSEMSSPEKQSTQSPLLPLTRFSPPLIISRRSLGCDILWDPSTKSKFRTVHFDKKGGVNLSVWEQRVYGRGVHSRLCKACFAVA